MLALAGIKNIDRYFNPMTPETEAQLVQQQEELAAQEQETAMTDAEALVQSEQYNADKQMEMQQLKLQIEAQKAIAVDDRDRDKMDQDLLIKAAEILGKYGTAVDTANIKKAQDEARYPDATPSQAVSGGRF